MFHFSALPETFGGQDAGHGPVGGSLYFTRSFDSKGDTMGKGLSRPLAVASLLAILASFNGNLMGADVKKAAERSGIDPRYKWNLEDIYPNVDAWEADFRKIKGAIPELESYRGSLAGSADRLLALLRLEDSLGVTLGKLYVYSNMKRDEDTANDTFQALADRASSLSTDLSAATAWMVPEILQIPEEQPARLAGSTRA